MDSGDQSQPYDKNPPFSLAARTPIGKRKRASVVRPPTPSPTCQERVHYPIFNPQNPRHNPSANSAGWNASDGHMNQSSSPRNSVRWMQGLPGRSLRKARSGLLALRSGMQRNSQQQPRSPVRGSEIPSIWSSDDSGEGAFGHQDDFPSAISEASTECDGEFGTGIYRTKCNCSSALVNEPGLYMVCPPTRASPSKHECLREVDEDSSPGASSDDHAMPPSLSVDRSQQHGNQRVSGFDSFPSCSESSETSDSSSSSDSSNSIAPRLGISLSTEPLRLFDRSRTASSMSGAKSSRSALLEPPADVSEEAPTEPIDVIDRAFTRAASEETLNSHMDDDDTLAEDVDRLPSPRYPSDFMEAWVSEVASSQREGEGDGDAIFSAGPSTHSNTHSEGAYTEPTSMSMSLSPSNNQGSSIGEEVLSLPSPRDEYFLLDGKHSYFRPDGGDNAVKADSRRMMGSDESGAQSSSLSRNPSDRFPAIQQVLGPGGSRPQRRLLVREGERLLVDGSDSTDSHFATYSLWQRRDGRFG